MSDLGGSVVFVVLHYPQMHCFLLCWYQLLHPHPSDSNRAPDLGHKAHIDDCPDLTHTHSWAFLGVQPPLYCTADKNHLKRESKEKVNKGILFMQYMNIAIVVRNYVYLEM